MADNAYTGLPALPLEGLTILNTREVGNAESLTKNLESKGALVLETPTLSYAPPTDWGPFDAQVRQVTADDWIVFTSATAVAFAVERIWTLNLPHTLLNRAKIAAIGQSTAQALLEHQINVHLVPERFQQEVLLQALLPRLTPRNKVWIPRAEEAREVLVTGLRKAGFAVLVTPVYRTLPPEGGLPAAAREALTQRRVDWILFTSSSTVTNFIAMLEPPLRTRLEARWPKVACLGAVTAETARAQGLPVAVVPQRQDLEGLVAALVTHVQAEHS
ncbi:MAG: uroporphyrinogen-III synthase [Deltaproteobacteria bacterium]|nr:uroporphyrinogen-III synthase [Deltaproteobacteria bacterium]